MDSPSLFPIPALSYEKVEVVNESLFWIADHILLSSPKPASKRTVGEPFL